MILNSLKNTQHHSHILCHGTRQHHENPPPPSPPKNVAVHEALKKTQDCIKCRVTVNVTSNCAVKRHDSNGRVTAQKIMLPFARCSLPGPHDGVAFISTARKAL